MSEWQKVNLLDVTSRIGDGLHGTPKYDDTGDYYFINGNNLQNGKIIIKEDTKKISENEYLKIKKELNDRTVFVAINGTLGNVGLYFDEKIALGKSACYLNINEDVNKHFIRYVIESQHFQTYAELFATGATIKNLSLKAVRKYPFLLPPLSTQKKIAKILSNYDDLIENNLKRIKLLEESARLTYEECFLRFRIDGEKLEIDSETGLPFGWEKKKNGDVCIVSGGGTPSKDKDEYWENGTINWFSPTDLSRAQALCLLESKTKTNELGIKKSSAKVLTKDSFMMTSRATIGLFGLMQNDFSTNQGFINITPYKLDEKYYLFLNFMSRVEEFKGIATGTTFPEISKGKFKPLDIIWPDNKSINAFHDICEKIYNEIFNLTNQNKLLKEARDILLPRLMTGTIDVEDMEVAV